VGDRVGRPVGWGQGREASKLAGLLVALEVVDDADAHVWLAEPGVCERLGQAAVERLGVGGAGGGGVDLDAMGGLAGLVVDDLGGLEQDGSDDVGVDVDRLVVEHLVGAAVHAGLEVAVPGASGWRTRLSASS
jgi:hypothetical protein